MNCRDYVVSNEMGGQLYCQEDIEGNSHDLFKDSVLSFAWRFQKKSQKTSEGSNPLVEI
jgi:hypothetical protein